MERPLTKNIITNREPFNLSAYESAGGYQAVRQTVGRIDPKNVLATVVESGLGGCGGGGFPTGRKWQAMPSQDERPGYRYFIVNADEMEPGTFKDRLLLEGDPHQLVEGIILSAYAIQANHSYVFIRGEYYRAISLIENAVAEAKTAGLLGTNILDSGFNLVIHVHSGAGRYICGEETALLNSLEGRRAIPRSKPPLPMISGLFGAPTIVNNVETVCNIPHIIANGADWFRSLGRNGAGGTKIFGVSGRVNKPGAYELPMGTPMREMIEDYAGGMKDGYELRALLPGGASTGFMLPEELDTPMSFSAFSNKGNRLGTGTSIILDDQTCPIGFIGNLQHFFAQESCGWCAPCRDGLPWVEQTLNAIESGKGKIEDLNLLVDLSETMAPGRTFCALAPGAMASLTTGLAYFRDEFERHIRDGECPWK